MPGIDGLTLAAEIRRSPPLSRCPIILLTSEDQPTDRTKRSELGIAAMVTKPVPEQELFTTVCRVLAGPAEGTAPAENEFPSEGGPHESPLTALHPLHILVAEDNELNQQVVQHLLTRHGHTVEIAEDGRAALIALEKDRFDLLLLDMHMPELDGFQVIKDLRRREQATGRHLPVVALTARSMKGDRERCLRAGMDDFLGKPIRRQELFAAIERVLPGGGRQQDRVTPANGSLSSSFLLDAATLLTACDGDERLLTRMVAVFRASTTGQLERVAAAVRDRDASGLREAAHRLRGVVSAFSTTAAEAAQQLEQAGTEQQLDGADAILDSLSDMVAELTPCLDKLTVAELRARLQQRPASRE
jgi:CheY-like chemotaxis protein/HPt (histidine-containing phosphotransfer) domain-containing protein